jgi:CRP/FNR family cyclic AMP-dependent transcriptional regulator
MQVQDEIRFSAAPVFSDFSLKTSSLERVRGTLIYAQGDPGAAVFYIRQGHVKLTVLSSAGKEAVVSMLGTGHFFGETCLALDSLRSASAVAVTNCVLTKIARSEMSRALKTQPAFSEFFLSHVLSRNMQLEAELADQLCNSCEQRLARILWVLSNGGQNGGSSTAMPRVNQETLAAMVGTTRPRISVLLSKFKKNGLIEYDKGLHVKGALVNVMLRPEAANF